MDVRPSTFASPVFLRCLFLFVVDETSKMPSLEFTCVHLKYLPDSASQAKITSWGFQALPLLIRLRTRSSAALEALVLLSLAEQQKWNQFCVIFQSQNQQGCVPGNGLSRAQGCSPWPGLKAKGRISPWTFSCAHLPAPDALPAPSLAQGWLLSAFHTDQTQSLGSALIPVMQEMQGMHWCCGEGSRHRWQNPEFQHCPYISHQQEAQCLLPWMLSRLLRRGVNSAWAMQIAARVSPFPCLFHCSRV